MNEICFDNSQNYLKNLNAIMSQSDSLYKYKYFAISLCQDLFILIENLKEKNEDFNINNHKIEEMKDFLKMIYIDIESMSNKLI